MYGDTGPVLTRNVDLLMISWKGSGNDNLNDMNSNDLSSKVILNETSDIAPSIAHINPLG
jgi:hypothetical protein